VYIRTMNLSELIQTASGIDHVAIAVKSIDASLPLYLALGGIGGEREVVAEQGVFVQTLSFAGSRIELLEPIDDNSPVGKFLNRRGEGLHHIAILVPDIRASLAKANEAGFKPLNSEPRLGAEGRLIAFLDPKTTGGVLIELTQAGATRARL